MTSRTTLRIAPLANVKRDYESEFCAWASENDDPQFLLGGSELPGGWYLFDARFRRIEGAIVSPCLYPDYGHGVSEVERIFLPEMEADGQVRAIIRLKHPVAQLRFDPTTKSARFGLAGVELRPLGRLAALSHMLVRTAGTAKRGRDMLSVLLAFLRCVLAGRIRDGGDLIYNSYIEAQTQTSNDYATWVRRFDTRTPADLVRMRNSAATLLRRPLISVVMPVYQTPERWLRRCLDSVLAQTYPHWELCIADDASPAPHVRRVLQQYMSKDARIRVVFRDTNGHIAAASNSALEIASGEYIALLDHDDELPPHALLEVAKAVQDHPEWKVIYSDEDKIDEHGRRFNPYFKPDWNYELFLSHNCISHLGVYSTALVRSVGGFVQGMEGSQDWDMALRCIERLTPGEIGHIPEVLYHWRAIPGSTALGPSEKNYADLAAMRAIQAHLDRRDNGGLVEGLEGFPGNYRVRYPIPTPAPKVSLVIPTRDCLVLLRQCIESILERTTYPNYEIIVVDNRSVERETLDYLATLERLPCVRVLPFDAPFNYSVINNLAVASCEGEFIGLINNDIEVISPDWLDELVSHAAREGVGAVGAKLFFPDNTIQHAGVILGFNGIGVHAYAGRPREWLGHMLRAQLIQQMSAVTAACLVIRKSVYEQVGGLDEHLSVAYNDVDFCLKLHSAGYRNVWTPYAELYHHESATRGADDTPEKQARFLDEVQCVQTRWSHLLERDPAYNPNLSITGQTFDLAFPPRQHTV